MTKKSKLLIAIFGILFLLIGIITAVIIYIKINLKPTSAFLNGEICGNGVTACEITPFVVDEGAYGKSTLDKLNQQGIIGDSDIVYYWNQILGGYTFYAGYYEIPHKINNVPVNLSQVLGWLSDPNNAHQDTVLIKFDEGDFARSFAYELAENVTLKENPTDDVYEKYQTIINYWNNESTIRGYMDEYPFITEEMFNSNCKVLLEGYLFPDTYEFFEYTDCDEITRRFLDRTLEIYDKYIDDFNNNKLSIHQLFTLASIVQWESGDVEDGMLVAGAFLNRMDNPEFQGTGGKFQSTVTACYAFDLTKDECDKVGDTTKYTETYDEYNTYTIEGFPPGAVCCPNEDSIYSALNANQDAGYYFFVADMCNGGTAFARTYAQHQANMDRYYLPCA